MVKPRLGRPTIKLVCGKEYKHLKEWLWNGEGNGCKRNFKCKIEHSN